jgi:hypothetical protein
MMFVMKNFKGVVKILMASALIFFASTITAYAATLRISPESGVHKVGDSFSVKLMIESGSTELNAVEAELSFDPSILSVSAISKTGSVFSLWTTEPTAVATANSSGTIELGGGAPSSFSGAQTIVSITFNAKKTGTGKIEVLSGTAVAPAQGFADVLSEKKGATFTIEEGQKTPVPTPTVPEPTPAPIVGTTPSAPKLTSEVFEDPEKWYATTTATFKWTIPYNVTAIKLLLDNDPTTSPSVLYQPPIYEKTVTDLSEGESYFHIMFQNSAGWGVPTHQLIRVDITPPDEFTLQALQRDPQKQDVTLVFNSFDELSGIDRYVVSIDGQEQVSLSADEVVGGEYVISVDDPGEHLFEVTAFDSAGNSTASDVLFDVKKAVTPQPVAVVEDEPEKEGVNWMYWLSMLSVAIIAFLIGAVFYERRSIREEKEYIRREANEAQKKIEGVFTVLRDEIEEQVVTLATKPNMTESERRVLEKLKEALEISEELLDKEVEDVRKLVQ